MTFYKVRAVKLGSAKNGGIARYKAIDVPGTSEQDACRKAEIRLGAEWGVFSATEKKK
jgi:hypothetical protein